MESRGGCCIARYSATAGGDGGGGFGEISYGMSRVERIMLKYRPIAPKPMAAGSGSSCSTVDQSDGYGGTPRRKRKYVRANGGKTKKEKSTVSKKRKVSPSSSSVSGGGEAVVTLPLISETPDRKEKTTRENRDLFSLLPAIKRNKPSPIFLSFNNHQQLMSPDHAVVTSSAPRSPPPPLKKLQVISVVTVECVTETWVNGDELGFTDQARVMNMEMHTCPSFITDNRDTVVWTNKAYKEMTAGCGAADSTAVVVKKFNRVTIPVSNSAFTCKVKVAWGTEGSASPATIIAPCDVWRLRTGGYVWRLDIKAALCLGR